MLDFTPDKGHCCGCSACMAICPVSCITMTADEEGFEYPISSDACIHCGLCERVCPISKPLATANVEEQRAYAMVSKNYSIWHRSASGGAFSEICNAWGDKDTIVVGATWNGLKVHHTCVKGVENIAELCKSKYVSSVPQNAFREVASDLKQGEKVIFCGTPCMVAGLKSFLRKNYQNLLTIDLICHGVGSPKVFEDAMEVIGKQFHTTVSRYEFRAKRRVFEEDYIERISTPKGEMYLSKDQYIQLFLSQLCLRPSCGKNCVFRCEHRQGDITIADFKGLASVLPDLIFSKRNYSSIITNNEKGREAVRYLKNTSNIYPVSIDDIKKFNPLFYRQTWFSTERDVFFKDYEEAGTAAIERWTQPAKLYRSGIKQDIINILPSGILKGIYKVYKKCQAIWKP